MENNIPIYSQDDFKNMHSAGSLAADVLDLLYDFIPQTSKIDDVLSDSDARKIGKEISSAIIDDV